MDNPTSLSGLVQWVTGIVLIACTSFVTYDYLLTFEQEVQYVWLKPWTAGKVLFLLVRYLFFLDTPILTWDYLTITPDITSCRVTLNWVAAVELPGLLVAWMVVGLRTWAIWNRSSVCGVLLGLAALASTATGVYDVLTFIRGLTASTRTAQGIPGCFFVLSSAAVQSTQKLFLVSAGYEALILLATISRGAHHLRGKRSSLATTLYRDALLASALLFTTSVLTAINASVQNDYFISYSAIHRAFMAVIPGRIILNIRREAYTLDSWDGTTETGPIISISAEPTDLSGWD